MDIKLLPCPFCGGEAIVYTDEETNCYMIGCKSNCAVEPMTEWCETEENAIAQWNTRKPMERILEQLEEESDFFGGEPMGSLQKAYYCKGIQKAIEIVKGGVDNAG